MANLLGYRTGGHFLGDGCHKLPGNPEDFRDPVPFRDEIWRADRRLLRFGDCRLNPAQTLVKLQD